MIPLTETISMLASFLFSYFLLFVWIPSLFIRFEPEYSTRLDKLFISLTHSTLFFMIAIHLLVGVRLLEPITLYAVSIAGIVLLIKYQSRKDILSPGMKLMISVFNLTDDKNRLIANLRQFVFHIKQIGVNQWNEAKQALVKHPFLFCAYLIVFGVGFINRFKFSFTHLSFASSDAYVHLGWSKYLAHMSIYLDGVYPFGFESIIAAIYEFFNMDMYVIIRFLGGLTNILMMLSLVYVLRVMIGKDYIAILLTSFLLFFSSAMMLGYPALLWREQSALSMEFAAIFMFPGIAFFYNYFKTDKTLFLILAAECFSIASFTHPFAVVNMTIAFFAIGIVHYHKLFAQKRLIKVIAYMGAAGFIGILPPIIGLLSGLPFHGDSLRYMKAELVTSRIASIPHIILSFGHDQPFVFVMFIFVLLYLIFIIVKRKISTSKKWLFSEQSSFLAVAMMTLLMIFIYLAPKMGLPSPVPPDREPIFLSMSIALWFGISFGLLINRIRLIRLRSLARLVITLTIVASVLTIPGQILPFPSGNIYEYDGVVRSYLNIKANYPMNQWDIISPVDELGLIHGYGFHTEIWEFVRDLDDSSKPTLTFTTPNVFLFVEKIPIDPLKQNFQPVTLAESLKPLPVNSIGLQTEFYYGTLQNRRIIEAKAYYWAEDYMKHHKDMTVLLETNNVKIYKIYQGKDQVVITKQGQVNSP